MLIESDRRCESGIIRQNNQDDFHFGGMWIIMGNMGLIMLFAHKIYA